MITVLNSLKVSSLFACESRPSRALHPPFIKHRQEGASCDVQLRRERATATVCVCVVRHPIGMRGLAASPQPTLRNIYAVSDVHAEYRENMQWCEELSDSYRNDVLIVAGTRL